MIPINGEKLALTSVKPKKGLRYKTVSASGWWLVKTGETQEKETYTKGELEVVKEFVTALWIRGYRKTMEQLVRATADKAMVECFYKSTSLPEFIGLGGIGGKKVKNLPKALYQKREYSVYKLCHDLVGKEVCIAEDLVGEYNPITDSVGREDNRKEWRTVTSILYNQQRENISLLLDGNSARCIIKDGTLNMPFIGVRGLDKKLPRGVKAMDLMIEGDVLLDLGRLPISSRSDFSRRLASKRLINVVAELEYAKVAKKQFSTTTPPPAVNPGKLRKKTGTYKAACLKIKTKFRPFKLTDDHGKDWKKEYERLKQEKARLVFEIFAKKLWTWQEPHPERIGGTFKNTVVGPEKILIGVSIDNISTKEINI